MRIRPGVLPGTLLAGASAEMPTIDVTTFDRAHGETQKVATLDEALARLGVTVAEFGPPGAAGIL